MRNVRILSALFLLLSAAPIAAADIIHVPADQPTIQAGIDAAVNGDEVVVADGLYRGPGNRELDFDGKAITLRSESTPQRCVIDCEGVSKGFIFTVDEGPDTVVSGFSVVNAWGSFRGGGMLISFASPTIHNCIIAYCRMGVGDEGAGIWCHNSAALIDRCTFYGNTIYSGAGAGLVCSNSSVTITNCAFVNNECSGSGGAIYSLAGESRFSNCLFQGNVATSGGAVCVSHHYLGPDMFTNCLFVGNESTANYDRGGGAVMCYRSDPIFYNCTFTGNSANHAGGALYSYWSDSEPWVWNSILWGNTPNEVENYLGNPRLRYCDIEGGYSGDGNIDADPLFVAGERGDYLLSQVFAGQAADSPCLDSGSGTASSICYDTPDGTLCLDQMTTRTDGVGDTFTVDMGFHYNDLDPLYPPPQEWSWSACGDLDGALRVYSIDSTPDYRLYAGTGPTGNVYLSEDGGASWVNTGQLEGVVHAFDVLPASDGKLYAAVATANAGAVFVSPNDGFSWSPTAALAGTQAVFCLLELPGPLLLAGTGPNGDVFATTDGMNWTAMGELVGAGLVNALIAASDGSLLAGTGPDGDVFRSTDGGVSWVAGGDLSGADDTYSLVELPGGAIIAGTSPYGNLFRSTDLGQTWEALADLPDAGIVAALAYHLDGRVYAATAPYGDVFRSDDLGETWCRTSDIYGASQVLSLHTGHDGHLYCGTAFNGDIHKSSGPLTVGCDIRMSDDEGTLPFQNHAYVDLINLTEYNRILSARIDVTLGNGESYSNWRGGYRLMAPGETFSIDWLQNFPALGSLVGDNMFRLTAADVTTLPYNAPPYPASGLTETSRYTVSCSLPLAD